MYRKSLILIFILALVPLIACAGRPSFGIEGELFFPKGDWANGLDQSLFFKFVVSQKVMSMFGLSLSVGSSSFTRSYESDAKLSMFPVVYTDAFVEKGIGKSPLNLGIFIGSNYTKEKFSYETGVEEGSVWGWSVGGLAELRFKFVAKPYLKLRYISRKDTNGFEIALGATI